VQLHDGVVLTAFYDRQFNVSSEENSEHMYFEDAANEIAASCLFLGAKRQHVTVVCW